MATSDVLKSYVPDAYPQIIDDEGTALRAYLAGEYADLRTVIKTIIQVLQALDTTKTPLTNAANDAAAAAAGVALYALYHNAGAVRVRLT